MTNQICELSVSLPFAQILDRLNEAIVTAGMTIFASIDHAAGARDVGLKMPPTTVIIFGSPVGGTPVMLSVPSAALDLPLRVLVRDGGDGRSFIAFHPIGAVLRLAGVPEELASRLAPAQQLLIDAVLS